jgi:hypothetical protein
MSPESANEPHENGFELVSFALFTDKLCHNWESSPLYFVPFAAIITQMQENLVLNDINGLALNPSPTSCKAISMHHE